MTNKLKFNSGDLVVINEKAKGLPDCIGKVVTVKSKIEHHSNYDYYVEIENYAILKVKESELNLLNGDEIYLYLSMKKHGKVIYYPTKEVSEVVKIDYLHKQVEIKFNDGAMQVINIDRLTPYEEEEIIKESEVVDFCEEMLNMFLGHYKNNDNTYTLPKKLLINILKGTIEEV
jgi:hypothetical protein